MWCKTGLRGAEKVRWYRFVPVSVQADLERLQQWHFHYNVKWQWGYIGCKSTVCTVYLLVIRCSQDLPWRLSLTFLFLFLLHISHSGIISCKLWKRNTATYNQIYQESGPRTEHGAICHNIRQGDLLNNTEPQDSYGGPITSKMYMSMEWNVTSWTCNRPFRSSNVHTNLLLSSLHLAISSGLSSLICTAGFSSICWPCLFNPLAPEG